MVTFREALIDDLPAIIPLLAEDDVVGYRENTSPASYPAYLQAFEAITRQDGNFLYVGEAVGGAIIAVAQLTLIPTLILQGTKRAMIEGIIVDAAYRGKGIGTQFIAFLAQASREHHCGILQLTTNKKRERAHHFYQQVGFTASHTGMKMEL